MVLERPCYLPSAIARAFDVPHAKLFSIRVGEIFAARDCCNVARV